MTTTIQDLERSETYLAADPGNPHLLAQAIDQSLALGLPERAAGHAGTALERHPDDPYFQARQGMVQLALRQWQAAADVLAPLLARQPDPALAYNLAYALLWLERDQEALDTLQPYRSEPLAPAVATLLVRLLHRLNRLEEALALIGAERARGQSDPAFLAAASVVGFDAGELELAQELSEAALAAGAARPLEALVTGGSLALGRTDSAQAARLFEEALVRNPEEGRSWSGLGTASLLDGDFAAARRHLEQAVRYLPRHIGTWHLLAWARLLGGDVDGARAAFEAALALDHNFGESHGGLAVIQASQGQHALAEDSIRRALGLDPDSLSARYARMILAGETADPERFRALAMRLLGSRPGLAGGRLADVVRTVDARRRAH